MLPKYLAGLIALSVCVPAMAGAPDFPNVLVILPDQHRADVLGVAGDPLAITPNLDRLARGGARFTRMVSEAPVCVPTRATLMTGYSSAAHQLQAGTRFDIPNTLYFAEVFKRAGYATGFSGKWHIDGSPLPFGFLFDEFYELRNYGYVPPKFRRGFDEWDGYDCCEDHDVPTFYNLAADPVEVVPFNDGRWEPTWQVDTFLDFAQRHTQQSRPWLYWMSMGPPHKPAEAPDEFFGLFSPDQFTPAPGVEDVLPPELVPELKTEMAMYYAMIAFVDHEVGRAMDGLADLGIDRNTVVVYLSDHGDLLGAHHDRLLASQTAASPDPNESERAELPPSSFAAAAMRFKNSPYTTAFRVPFIVSWPGVVPAGTRVEALASTVDVAPTLLSLAGLPVPWRMQGEDLRPWLLGERGPERDALLLRADSERIPWSAVWTGDHLFSPEPVFRSLFDYRDDPYERVNRVDDPRYAPLQAELQATLNGLIKKYSALPAQPDLCTPLERTGVQQGPLLDRLGSDPGAFVLDGLPIGAYLALFDALACSASVYPHNEVTGALRNAYAQNVDTFDLADFDEHREARELIVLLSGAGAAAHAELAAALAEADPSAPLEGAYVPVLCVAGLVCTPDSIARDSADAPPRGTPAFPLSGSGDLDEDGISNAQEYRNVLARGGTAEDFARAAADPGLSGDEDLSSGCFIATAAYGTPLARQLGTLRAWRDAALHSGPLGSAAVDAYYRLSPPVARVVSQGSAWRTTARAGIESVLFLARHLEAALIMGTACAAWILLRRRSRP